MTIEATCEGCGEVFEARRTTARWCSDRCRKQAARGSDAQASEPAAPVEPTDSGLVESVRRDLEAAGRVDTFAGQLALQLARRLSTPDESGISSLSKELRTVMAAALEGVIPPSAEGGEEPAPVEEDEDEVTKARRQREEARQAAGLA